MPVTMNLFDFVVQQGCVRMVDYLPKDKYVYGTDFLIAEREVQKIKDRKIAHWWENNNGTTFTLPYTTKGRFVRVLKRSKVDNIEDGYVYNFLNRQNKLPEMFKLNHENGLFIGLFLAEGNTHGSTLTITNNNISIRNFVKRWFTKHSIHHTERQRVNDIGGLTTTVTGFSAILVQFMDKFVGKGASNKFVPSEAYTAPTEFIKGLLNGYFSGDGCVARNDIVVSSASKKLTEGISFLCSTLGIFGKFSISNVKINNLGTKNIKTAYRFSIRSKWAKIFSETINFLDGPKNKKLKSIKPTKEHREFSSHNDVVLDRIVIIEKMKCNKKEKLYDLTIPSTLNFGLANGLQVADTSISGYIQRKLVKKMEDVVKSYAPGLVVNSKNMVIQFNYQNNFDPARLVRVGDKMSFVNIKSIAEHLNVESEWEEWQEKKKLSV